MAKILFIEDDKELGSRVVLWLRQNEKHVVEHAQTGAQALENLDCFSYDVVVLDIGLPDMSGLEVLKKFRDTGGKTPVLCLTGRDQIEQRVEGLDCGADDYLTKPFDVRELSARIRTLTRRPTEMSGTGNVVVVGSLELNAASHKVTFADIEIKLTVRELSLLEYLMRHADNVCGTEEIINRVWHSDTEATSETVYTHIKNLRKQLAAAGCKIIETVHGAGYVIRKNNN